MNYLYIDANIYLKFFLGNRLFNVLQTLIDNKGQIIVTGQIRDEVLRNSVSVNINNLNNTVLNLKWKKPTLPYKNTSAATLALIDDVYTRFKQMKLQVETDLENHLALISTQSDDITRKLKELFENALAPSEEELKEAEKRKQFGNPPGKKADPIGDELSWIQMLNKLAEGDKLVIVTNDRDYASSFNNKSFLNARLHQELAAKNIEYFVFTEILEGIDKLQKLQAAEEKAFAAAALPSMEEQKHIKEEEAQIIVKKTEEQCSHMRVGMRMNGIYDEFVCWDCGRVLSRQISDDID